MAPRSPNDRASSDREVSRDYRLLFRLARFAMPYRWYIAGATVALMVAAGTTLALGAGSARVEILRGVDLAVGRGGGRGSARPIGIRQVIADGGAVGA